jgi:arylsulfatase A-like enzyme
LIEHPLSRILFLSISVFLLLIRFCVAVEQPNVVFILTDDWGYGDYGVFFQQARAANGDRSEPWHFTPQLDTMAQQGAQLRQHYCPAPVCAPSRASLLTGVHQGHSNIRDNQFDKALEDNHTLGSVMRNAGYATAAIGKWGLQGYDGSLSPEDDNETNRNPGDPGPQVWPAYPTKRGFDFYYGYVRHRDGHAHYPHEDGKQVWENDREVSADLAGCYTTDLFTARAKKWICDQQSSDPQKPFFLYLAYDTPHAILQLPAAKFPAGGGVAGGVQWIGQPGQMINTAGGPVDSYVHPDYADATWDHDKNSQTEEQPWPDVYQRYAAGVRRIDNCVGDLLCLLDDLDIGENTLVVFTTDNGPSKESYLRESYHPDFFNSFGPFDGIKRDVWEGGTRTGAIVRWPLKIAAGQVSEVPCQSHDWMPTLTQLAGVAAPARCDGVSLLPALTGKGQQQPSKVYVEYANKQRTPSYPEFERSRQNRQRQQMQAIRDGDFVGVRYDIQSHCDPFEIYNVVRDPKQTRNLAKQNPELQRAMHDAVLRLRRPNPSAPRPYDNELIPAVESVASEAGVRWQAYQTTTPWLARLDDLQPVSEGVSTTIESVPGLQDKSLLLSGLIDIPSDGSYTFTIPAGANALLRIHHATVLDAAFQKSESETSGEIRLQAGKHPFRLYWGPAQANPGLKIYGPTSRPKSIPAAMLLHDDS